MVELLLRGSALAWTFGRRAVYQVGSNSGHAIDSFGHDIPEGERIRSERALQHAGRQVRASQIEWLSRGG